MIRTNVSAFCIFLCLAVSADCDLMILAWLKYTHRTTLFPLNLTIKWMVLTITRTAAVISRVVCRMLSSFMVIGCWPSNLCNSRSKKPGDVKGRKTDANRRWIAKGWSRYHYWCKRLFTTSQFHDDGACFFDSEDFRLLRRSSVSFKYLIWCFIRSNSPISFCSSNAYR